MEDTRWVHTTGSAALHATPRTLRATGSRGIRTALRRSPVPKRACTAIARAATTCGI